jgi:hypothetical protein
MRYVAQVTIAFPSSTKGRITFDIWESTLVLDAGSPSEALRQALSDSRTVFDDPRNLQELGYTDKPSLYAIRSLQDEIELPAKKANCNSGCLILRMIGTFDEAQMAKIVAFQDVLIPYHIIYAD